MKKMYFDPNKSYRMVDIHSGKGLGTEVYSNYDYLRETSNAGVTVHFEPATKDYTCKIRVSGNNWANYNYLTLASNEWIYLDTKDNATEWYIKDRGVDLFKFQKYGVTKDIYLGYIYRGDKKWLAGTNFDDSKSFQVVPI
ncbi:hypothetical protein IAE22_24170 [Bacillus sp. S34]|nr:hypothetical protein [Bacillus sp. S34]